MSQEIEAVEEFLEPEKVVNTCQAFLVQGPRRGQKCNNCCGAQLYCSRHRKVQLIEKNVPTAVRDVAVKQAVSKKKSKSSVYKIEGPCTSENYGIFDDKNVSEYVTGPIKKLKYNYDVEEVDDKSGVMTAEFKIKHCGKLGFNTDKLGEKLGDGFSIYKRIH